MPEGKEERGEEVRRERERSDGEMGRWEHAEMGEWGEFIIWKKIGRKVE